MLARWLNLLTTIFYATALVLVLPLRKRIAREQTLAVYSAAAAILFLALGRGIVLWRLWHSAAFQAPAAGDWLQLAAGAALLGGASYFWHLTPSRAAARHAALRYGPILDGIPEPVALYDADLAIIHANPAWNDRLGQASDLWEMLEASGDGARGSASAVAVRALAERGDAQIEVGLGEALLSLRRLDAPEGAYFLASVRPVETPQRGPREAANGFPSEKLSVVSQLAAGIAHDFNNLLTSILGFAELLQSKPGLDPETRDDLGVIICEGRRGARLVQQIQDFGCQSLIRPTEVDLRLFLEEMIEAWSSSLPAKIRLVPDLAAAPVIRGGQAQLGQMLTNLVHNARDAMPEGGALRIGLDQLEVSAGSPSPLPSMAPGSWARITVADEGIGMSAEVQSHLYEPFFTTKPPGRGSGLGLAQAYGIIQQHGGRINAQSAPGQGTTFAIYLPLQGAGQPTGALGAESRPGILLVDPDPLALGRATEMLESLGYRVLQARDGFEALEVCQHQKEAVDLVISAQEMPVMSGLELLGRLRRTQPTIRFVLSGGSVSEERALAKGAVGCVQKPLDPAVLARVISEALNSRGVSS